MDTFTHKGLTFALELKPDDDRDPPWKHFDAHGPVSDWRDINSKRAGEWVLTTDGGSARFYDSRAARAKAIKDGWGLTTDAMAMLVKALGREPTAREIIAEAVRFDFRYLRDWCNDVWSYVGVQVTLLTVDGQRTDLSDSAWGFESNDDGGHQQAARDIADELAAKVGDGKHYTKTVQVRA